MVSYYTLNTEIWRVAKKGGSFIVSLSFLGDICGISKFGNCINEIGKRSKYNKEKIKKEENFSKIYTKNLTNAKKLSQSNLR